MFRSTSRFYVVFLRHHKLILTLILTVMTLPTTSLAQDYCAHDIAGTAAAPESLSSQGADIPTSGDFRALIVFVRYLDDDDNRGGC